MFANVPQELRQYSQWICWKLVDTGKAKPDKVPFQVNGYQASITNPAHWSDFFTAVSASTKFDGIGFVLTPTDPFCFIDFDETYDPATIAEQQRIFRELDSYSEYSPSGTGLHIICKAQVPIGRKTKVVEIYSSSRYMTITGEAFHNVPIAERHAEIKTIYDRFTAIVDAPANPLAFDRPEEKSDLDIYNIAFYATNGEKFLALWNGDFHTYHGGDQSRADFALIDILAYYTKNREQIKRLFRLSVLGQRKKAEREDYLNTMINRAFDNMLPDVDISGLSLEADTLIKQYQQWPIEAETYIEPQQQQTYEPEPEPIASVYHPGAASDIDSGAFAVPTGLLGLVAKFIYDQSYKPIPEIAIVGAVGYLAGMAGRAYNVSNTGLNMYLLLLAGTGRGKEEMARGISKLTQHIEYTMPTIADFLGPGDLASGQGLLRFMSNHPTKSFCSIFGEFGIRLKAIANPKSMASDLMLQKLLLDMFSKSGATDVLRPTVYSDDERNTHPISSPSFSMIGESSPGWFYEHIDEQMITTGLLPRFTVIDYSGHRPPSNYNASRVVPSAELIGGLCNLATSVYKLLNARQPYEVPFDSEAITLSKELDRACDDRINYADNPVVAELWNRAHLKTMRLAALIAVGNNPIYPVITAECWRWAEKFTQHGIHELSEKFAVGFAGETPEEHKQIEILANAIVSYLSKTYEQVAGYEIPAALHNAKIVPYSYISKYLRPRRAFKDDRFGPTNAIKRTLQIMLDNGELQEVPSRQSGEQFNYHGKCYAIRSVKLLALAAKNKKPSLG